MMILESKEGLTVCVDSTSVKHYSRAGYQVVAVVEHEVVVPAQRQSSHVVPYAGGGGHVETGYDQVSEKIRQPLFLMRLDANSSIAVLEKECAELGDKLEKASAELPRLRELVDEAKKVIAEKNERIDSCRQETERCREQVRVEQERTRKLEGDIGRLGRAIGDLRMREILDVDKKQS